MTRIICLLLLLLLPGCATVDPVLRDADASRQAGRSEEALLAVERAMRAQPGNARYRAEYFRQRDLLLGAWLAQAEGLRASGAVDAAAELWRRVLEHDPQQPRARQGLAQLDADARHRRAVAQAETLAASERPAEVRAAQALLRAVLAENPQQQAARRLQRALDERAARASTTPPMLRLSSSAPMSLELREVPLRAAFEVISRNAGISFVLDKDVRAEQPTTFVMRDAPVEELIALLLASHQLAQKVVNPTTVMVFPNTPQKLREHQELAVKSFYIANADVRQTAAMLRAVLRTRDLFIDEKLGLLVLRDTPAGLRMAERLIAAQDLAEPEVMLEVEVLEVASNRLLELGVRFPDSLAVGLAGAGGAGTLTLAEWLNRSSGLVQLNFSNPLFLLSLRQQDGASSVLANPRIRVKNREKARVHIGDRVPVITTTAAATGGFVSESVAYLDVGVKLDVEPVVYPENEVGIRIALEVSNIVREVRSPASNTLTYQIGTRNAATMLRLRDGETQVLAGLIGDEDRRNASRVPGLGELPVLGRLFSHTRDSVARTEIVLLMTPRVVRTLRPPEARLIEFPAGPEGVMGGAPPSQPASYAPGQVIAPPAPPPAALPMVPMGGIRSSP